MRRYIVNKEYDKEKYDNPIFIEDCLDFILNENDNLNLKEYKYYEKDSKRKIEDALFYLQLNGKHISLFNDISFLEKHKEYLEWELISCDNRLDWNDSKKIQTFKDKLITGRIFDEYLNHSNFDFIQRGTRQIPSVCGISMNPNLDKRTIYDNWNFWDWEILSNNPAIFQLNIFDRKIFPSLIRNLLFSANRGLTIEHLEKIKQIYSELKFTNKYALSGGFFGDSFYQDEKLHWSFSWEEAFKYAEIDWNENNIKSFLDILNNDYLNYSESEKFSEYCWNSISCKIYSKELIVKFSDKLNFLNLSYNEKIIWDDDLLKLLIARNYKGNAKESDGYYGSRVHGLPYIIENINITEDAILKNIDFWGNTYLYGRYRRTSDGTEKEFSEFQYYWSLEKNKKIKIPNEVKKLYG